MAMPKPDVPTDALDELITQPGSSAQLIADPAFGADADVNERTGADTHGYPCSEESTDASAGTGPGAEAMDDTADEAAQLQTREEYLKKGEDLIRSLL